MKKTLAVIVLFVAALICGALGYRAHLVSGLKEHLVSATVDPGSVQFRNTRMVSDWTAGGSAVCGEMNARNRAGGYEGHQKFIVLGSGYFVVGDDELVEEMCSAIGKPQPWWYLQG